MARAQLTGFAPLPAEWTLGFQQSRYGYNSAAQITGIAQMFRSLNIPVDSIYFDLDYQYQLQLFTYNYRRSWPDSLDWQRVCDFCWRLASKP